MIYNITYLYRSDINILYTNFIIKFKSVRQNNFYTSRQGAAHSGASDNLFVYIT